MTHMSSESRESSDDPPGAGGRTAAETPSEARRRAIAYLDLWERQLAQVASEGVAQPRRPAGVRRG